MSRWFVYIVRCSDDTLYTGITKDLAGRVGAHNGEGRSGAKYTKSRRPVTLVYSEDHESRASASRREVEIKRFDRRRKEALIGAGLEP